MLNNGPNSGASLTIQGGFHLPISPGIATGPNVTWDPIAGTLVTKPDVALGTIADFGGSFSISGDPRYSSPATINIGLGKYLGVQFVPSNATASYEKDWYDPSRYLNGFGAGVGAAVAAPVTATVDPTYVSPTPQKR